MYFTRLHASMSSDFTFTFLFHIHRREFFHKNSLCAILVAENTERKHASDRTKNKLQTPVYGKADCNSVVYFNVIIIIFPIFVVALVSWWWWWW